MRLPMSHAPRHGMSLLEVLIALTIFLFSLIVIGRLVNIGSDRAVEIRDQLQAAQLCQSKLNEVLAGATSLSSQTDVPFEEDDAWLWTLECEEHASITGLWNVTVKVRNAKEIGRVEVSLSQMVMDPTMRGSTADIAAAATPTSDPAAEAAAAAGSTTSGSSGTSSSGSSGASAPTSGATSGNSAAPRTSSTPTSSTTTSMPAAAAPTTKTGTSGAGSSKTGGRSP